MENVGIIGFGSFGQFMAKHLQPHCNLTVCDIKDVSNEASELGVSTGSLEEVVAQEVVILGVPVQGLEELLKKIKDSLNPNALFIDVCSVKVKPVELMLEHLPESAEIIATHPLFGPRSGADGIEGLKIALCKVRCNDERYDGVKKLLAETLKLDVLERTPEEHDKDVAYAQVLTHFIGRALTNMEIPELEQTTKTYDHLMDVMHLLSLDSLELFLAIQKENPFASEVRKKFLDKLHELDDLASN